MYKKGEYVVHSLEGVCEVADIVEMPVGRDRIPYYQLTSWPDKKTTVYVPVNQENGKVRVRDILNREDVAAVFAEIRDDETPWIADIGTRQEVMLRILKEGSPLEMARMTKMLMKKDIEKPLGSRDKATLLTAQKVLFSEIAMVAGTDTRSVLRQVKENLKNPELPLMLL